MNLDRTPSKGTDDATCTLGNISVTMSHDDLDDLIRTAFLTTPWPCSYRRVYET